MMNTANDILSAQAAKKKIIRIPWRERAPKPSWISAHNNRKEDLEHFKYSRMRAMLLAYFTGLRKIEPKSILTVLVMYPPFSL